jgi:hypothetical protein
MFQARMTAVVRRLAPGVPFGEGLKLSAEMMTTMPELIRPSSLSILRWISFAGVVLRQRRRFDDDRRDRWPAGVAKTP